MFLAESLPNRVVARLGPGGVAKLARFIDSCLKRGGKILRTAMTPLRWGVRKWREIKARRAAIQHRKHVESRFMTSTPGNRNLGVLFDGRVMLEGFNANASTAHLWLRSIKPVQETCQVFVHLYPEKKESLPPERQIHGYLCKDHYPAIEIKNWRRDRYFRDDISLAGILPGFYRVEAGIIDVATFRKFPVDGSARTSVDLGWVRIGTGGGT